MAWCWFNATESKPQNVVPHCRKDVVKRQLKMTTELENLINDFGGGREKQTKKSQLFYNLASEVLWKLNSKPYTEVEQFSEYLKEIAKRISCVNVMGKETNQ
jgi:esterase/lipase